MSTLTINVGEPLFSFRSVNDWVSKGPALWHAHGVDTHSAICVDQKGRVIQRGAHFRRAEADGAYPVVVYRVQTEAIGSAA